MSMKEFYEKIRGDYKGVLERLGSKEELVEKFAFKFLDDKSYDDLKEALSKEDYEVAFRSCHTLKGVVSNLGFTELYNVSSVLTEKLRSGDKNVEDDFSEVSKVYEEVIACLKEVER